MPFVAIPGVFYLDDPQDGASVHLLASIGVTVLRAGSGGAAAGVPADATPATFQHQLEHSHAGETTYTASKGSILLDVRDSADAWVRIVLHEGDAVRVAAGKHVRLPPAGTRVVTMPDFGPHPDRDSRQSTVVFPPPPGSEVKTWGVALVSSAGGASPAIRFAPGSAEEAAANVPHFQRPGTPHMRSLVSELCESFYHLGWVTGTGGSISIRHGDRIFMAPSGVQKERMQPHDIFVLDTQGQEIYAPAPLPGKRRLGLSQCAPLFHHAFTLRNAGACIHTHDVSAVMCTLQNATEFKITHQEMIKGVAGHGFLDECVVPIIENTPHECDLADSLEEAMRRYPRSNAVLVRRHGVYVWGASWEAAKTQAECYHYLFDAAVRMRAIGVDPGATPTRVADGIGAETSYGTEGAGTGGRQGGAALAVRANGAAAAAAAHAHSHAAGDACCGGAGAVAEATSSGFHGAAGVSALTASGASASGEGTAAAPLTPEQAAALKDVDAVVLDIEGTTTPLSFVTDVLFPYAAAHLRGHLEAAWGTPELVADVEALAALSAADIAAANVPGADSVPVTAADAAAVRNADAPAATRAAVIAAVASNVEWQMGSNRKSGALKQLQGHIWRAGYEAGTLKGLLFDDFVPALEAWRSAGKKVYIYSSGSREAQRLLFAYSNAGDVRHLLSGFFDTAVGAKIVASSYTEIALTLGVDAPGRILFATDAVKEAVAAREAGLKAVITDRPGNLPLPGGHGFPVIASLLEVA